MTRVRRSRGGKCGDYYEPVNIFDKRTYGATQCLLFHGGRHGNNDHGLSNCKLQKYNRGDTFVKRSGTKYHRKSDKIIGYPNILRGTVGVATDRPIKTYKVEHPFVSAKQVADQALNLAKLNLPITSRAMLLPKIGDGLKSSKKALHDALSGCNIREGCDIVTYNSGKSQYELYKRGNIVKKFAPSWTKIKRDDKCRISWAKDENGDECTTEGLP